MTRMPYIQYWNYKAFEEKYIHDKTSFWLALRWEAVDDVISTPDVVMGLSLKKNILFTSASMFSCMLKTIEILHPYDVTQSLPYLKESCIIHCVRQDLYFLVIFCLCWDDIPSILLLSVSMQWAWSTFYLFVPWFKNPVSATCNMSHLCNTYSVLGCYTIIRCMWHFFFFFCTGDSFQSISATDQTSMCLKLIPNC